MRHAHYYRLIQLTAYPLVLLMLGLAWWNPRLLPQSDPMDLVVLMDESQSMDTAFADRFWPELPTIGSLLADGSHLSLIRFADRSRLEIPMTAWSDKTLQQLLLDPLPPRRLALNRGTTALTAALQKAAEQLAPKENGLILLLSDGRDNTSRQAPRLPDPTSGKTLFWHAPSDRGQSSPLEMRSLNAPDRVRPGLTFRVSVSIVAAATNAGVLSLKLDERLIAEQSLALQQGERRVYSFQLSAETPGAHRLVLSISDTQGRRLDARTHWFETAADRRLLYVTNRHDPSLTPTLLEQEGWRVSRMRPAQLTSPDPIKTASVLLLEDIASHELAPAVLARISTAVQQEGMGLVVLGGPNSFGSGGYRHSPLERLLPVIAESARPEPAAAFIFLVDKSGSMDDPARPSQSRLASAFRAVTESARSLRPGDSVGLIVFDRSPQILQPLQETAVPFELLSQTWQVHPSGGTQLEPALRTALSQLKTAKPHKRFLVLVTDGFVEQESLSPLLADLKQSEVSLIALAIGEDADFGKLEQLAAVGKGQVLRVNKTADLPKFMRQSLEQQRQSWQADEIEPHTLRSLPFEQSSPTSWKPLPGYQLSRLKPQATNYVGTLQGDPLLAVIQAGTGRVAALPGGILVAEDSTQVMHSLLSWIDTQLENPRLQLTHESRAGRLILRLDALDNAGHWHRSPFAQLILQTPVGLQEQHRLPLIAPGRYEADIQAPVSGLYRARVEVNGERLSCYIHHVDHPESADTPVAPWLLQGLEQGTVQHWSEQALLNYLSQVKSHRAVREVWLSLALAIFLLLILFERRAGLVRALSILHRERQP